MNIHKTTSRKMIYSAAFFLAATIQSNVCFAEKEMQTATVVMQDDYFSPSIITISAGDKVVWVNKGKKNHTVTSSKGYFDSEHIPPGSSFSYTFTKPGTYDYSCTLHTLFFFGMKGKVIVK